MALLFPHRVVVREMLDAAGARGWRPGGAIRHGPSDTHGAG